MYKKAFETLRTKEFAKIEKQEILAIILPLKKMYEFCVNNNLHRGFKPDSEVMFRLEPYIIKYLQEWDPIQLTEIYLTYLTFRKGTVQFMEFLISALSISINQIPLKCKEI